MPLLAPVTSATVASNVMRAFLPSPPRRRPPAGANRALPHQLVEGALNLRLAQAELLRVVGGNRAGAVVEHADAAVLEPVAGVNGPGEDRRLGAPLGLDGGRRERGGLDDAGELGPPG